MFKQIEFTDRELDAIAEENKGNPYLRANRIAERAIQARIDAVLKEIDAHPIKPV